MYELFLKLVDLIESLGYVGIFIMTFVESTFVPIPSEVTMVPAGYLVYQQHFNFTLALLSGISGTLGGSLFNYWIAKRFGRMLLVRYGKYFFISEKKLNDIEYFFSKHGAISTFSGRLLPGIKHFISFPAGLGKMDIKLFAFYTTLGGTIWNTILLTLGYYIGENSSLIKKYLPQVNIAIITILILIGFIYYYKHKKHK